MRNFALQWWHFYNFIGKGLRFWEGVVFFFFFRWLSVQSALLHCELQQRANVLVPHRLTPWPATCLWCDLWPLRGSAFDGRDRGTSQRGAAAGSRCCAGTPTDTDAPWEPAVMAEHAVETMVTAMLWHVPLLLLLGDLKDIMITWTFFDRGKYF